MIRTPIYKGLTRPACYFGIPAVPFVMVSTGVVIVSFWIYLPLVVVLIPILLIMRAMADKDSQIFHLLWLDWNINRLRMKNKPHWNNVASLSPSSFKKREVLISRRDLKFIEKCRMSHS